MKAITVTLLTRIKTLENRLSITLRVWCKFTGLFCVSPSCTYDSTYILKYNQFQSPELFSFASAPGNQFFVLVPSDAVMFPFLVPSLGLWFSGWNRWWGLWTPPQISCTRRGDCCHLIFQQWSTWEAVSSTRTHTGSLQVFQMTWQNFRVFKSDPELVNLAV